MKIVLLPIAGLTIGILITISAFQLVKVVVQELSNMAHEAWSSSEQLHTDLDSL
jgi:divalent metal cation (Fe/Co/Zn/Cd) transporter